MSEVETGSGPWPIPNGWVWSTLGDVATVVGGGTPRTEVAEYWKPGEIPWLTPADLSDFDGMRIRAGSRFISQSGLENSSAKLLPEGTVLFSSRAPIGYVAIADGPIATNQGFRSFVLDEQVIPEYLFYYLKGNTHLAVERARGTTFKEISGSNAARIPVPVPPKPVQAQIVEFISTYLTRLDAAERSLNRADLRIDRYRASVLQAACEGRLVPTEAELARREGRDYEPAEELLQRILAERRARWEAEELEKLKAKGKEPKADRWKEKYKQPEGPDTSELPELPEGWLWASVDQIAEVIGGLTKNRKRKQLDSRVPYLRVANVYANELILDDVKTIGVKDSELNRVLLEKNDLLIVEGNGSLDQIGRVAMWDGSIEPCAHQNHLIKARFVRRDMAKFVLYWLLSEPGRQHITKVASSTSGLYTLSLSKVSKLPIPVPPIPEQRRIVDTIESESTLAEAARRQITTAQRRADRLRRSVLRAAFEGSLATASVKPPASAKE